MRKHGQGSILRRAGTQNLFIRYYSKGRQVQEAVGSPDEKDAQDLLNLRLGEAMQGQRAVADVKRVKYDEVRALYLTERPFDAPAKTKLSYLDGFFTRMRVVDITSDTIRDFIKKSREQDKLADPTIRRILVMLRSMLNQARKEGKIRAVDVPYFPMPEDSKPRKGFLQPDQFAKLHDGLPENLRPIIKFCYFTGCRIGAAQKITWDMVSRDCTEIELPGEITKNGEPLTLPLVGPLEPIAAMLKKMFRDESKPVFSNYALRRGWCMTCHKLGLGKYDEKTRVYSGLTIHDLRRSAVRNLVRAGVPQGIAMSISGHRTAHVFERYNISDTADKKAALIKVGEYAEQMQAAAAKR